MQLALSRAPCGVYPLRPQVHKGADWVLSVTHRPLRTCRYIRQVRCMPQPVPPRSYFLTHSTRGLRFICSHVVTDLPHFTEFGHKLGRITVIKCVHTPSIREMYDFICSISAP